RQTGTLACCDCRVLVPPPSLSPAAVSLILVRVTAPSQRTDGGPSSRCGEETEKDQSVRHRERWHDRGRNEKCCAEYSRVNENARALGSSRTGDQPHPRRWIARRRDARAPFDAGGGARRFRPRGRVSLGHESSTTTIQSYVK